MRDNTFAELFAGIGLVRLALEEAGWDCVFANDIDPKKAEIYAHNFGTQELLVRDVREVSAGDIPGSPGLVTGSFPCIDVSLAGNRAGLNGTHSGLFWELARILGELGAERRQPSFVLLENVTGLLTSNGGADLYAIIEALGCLGYRCDLVTLDASHFVPQSRARLFVIAAHEMLRESPMRPPQDLLETITPELRPRAVRDFIESNRDLAWGRVDIPRPPTRERKLKDVLEDLPDSSPWWWPAERVDAMLATMSQRHRETVERHRSSGKELVATVFRRTRAGRAMAEVRADGIAGCLRVARGGSSKQILLLVRRSRVRARLLTPRECARLQGVPDDFVINVPRNQALSGFGDAVCVPAVSWIARSAFPTARPTRAGVPQLAAS